MLTTEQVKHFDNCVNRVKKIIIGTVDDKSANKAIAYHIRVSRRQMASGQWSLGFIFGRGSESEWMKIIDVTAEEMRQMVNEYRDMFHDMLHKN